MIFKSLLPLAIAAATFTTLTLNTLTHAANPASDKKVAKGKVFDHILIIFLENKNYPLAASDPYFQTLSQQAIALTNYHALTHPSEPNYIAAIAGDYYGLNNDLDTTIPANYTTVVDLLEPKGLTWKAYQEDMPSVCFEAGQAPDDLTTVGKREDGLYFRKHNPFIIHESISKNATRCKNIVPASQLAIDLAASTSTPLPNYMFYSPNAINNGHNTTVRDASLFLASLLPPILASPSFSSSNSLIVITFDETDDYLIQDNLVYTLLLGSNDAVIPASLRNTADTTFYTHYSLLSTVENNWDLGTLGRNDANKRLANVFNLVANRTGYENFQVAAADVPVFNETVPGFLTGVPHHHGSHSPSDSPSSYANTLLPTISTTSLLFLVSIMTILV
ncbi:MAG: phosphoesterase family-domain-containing protein [Linnemannia gamsii]|nr:MAG: phosphoesterase family-domain-containing protein [Linnemannia gamsii]